MTPADLLAEALAAAVAAGEAVPCIGRSEWLSESAEDRAAAADDMKPNFGTWAAKDRTRTQPPTRKKR